MTSYDNAYNRSLRNRVMGLDVANIGNDKMQASKTPLRQGGAGKKQRRKDASLLDDVDFRQGGLKGEGFFDDLLDGLKKGAEVANTSLDLYNKVGQTFGKKGMGMSGGVRRGAELSDAMAPQGVTGKMLARAPIAKGSRKGSAFLAGSGMRGGYGDSTNYEPNWRKIEAAQAKDGFIGAGDSDGDMEGGDFFSDLLSGINSVAGVVGPIAQIAGKFGAGQSGGKKLSKAQQQRLAARIAQLQGRGAGTYGMPELLGMEGSGPISDLGIPGLSQIAGLFGLGMSGGALDDGAQDPAFKTPAPAMKQDMAAQALASAFLGGRHPSKVSKAEKKMLFMKALADAKMHHELGNLMQGRGMSGGAAPLMCGLGLSGGDFFSDLLGTIGKVGQTALQVAPLFGLGDVREVGGAYQPMQGSGLTDMPALNATPSRYSYGKMGNIAGMANGAGMPAKAKKKQLHGGYLPAPPTQVGVSMSGMGQDSESDSEEDEMEGGDFFGDLVGTIGNVAQTAGHLMPLFGLGEQDREVGAGKLHIVHGGGKSSWINHVKAYAAKHNCSYKDALKRAAASYRK